jgi:ABC-type polysaccharide/polyol phosphate transport system ATPase subunit
MDYVRCEGVHKAFVRKYGAPTLRAHVGKTQRGKVDQALTDVSFRVASGEAIGVLGRRQSGRSTLISVLNGLYRPDQGSVHVRGRPTGPIAMGVGFVSDMAAADNITLNARLLGMAPADIDSRREAIIEFSRLKPVELTSPLRELEPRARQRLSYSIVLHAAPDVFLADDRVLVGDKDFRDASMTRLEALRDAGCAMVLATNRRPLLRQLCSRAIVLEKGEIVFDGALKPAFRTLRELRSD